MKHELLVGVMLGVVGMGVGAGCGASKKPDKATREALEYVPRDAQVVASFNVDAMRDSAMWDQLSEALARDPEYHRFKQCGIDLLDALDRITIAVRDTDEPSGVVVIQGANSKKYFECIATDKSVNRDGDAVVFKDRRDRIVMKAAGSDTIVGVFGRNATTASLERVIDGDSTITDDTTFAAIAKQIDMRDTMWFVVAGDALADAHLLDPGPTALGGSVGITDARLDAKLVVRFASADAAKEAEADARALVRLSRSESVDIDRDGGDLRITLEFSDATSKQLLRKLGR